MSLIDDYKHQMSPDDFEAIQNGLLRAEVDLEKEQDRIRFEQDKVEYELLLKFQAIAEKEFRQALENLSKAESGEVRDAAMQELMGSKQMVDMISARIGELEKDDRIKELPQEKEAVSSLFTTLDNWTDQTKEKLLDMKDKVKDSAIRFYESSRDAGKGIIDNAFDNFNRLKESITSRGVAAVSLITNRVKEANKQFSERGEKAYLGVGIKAKELAASFMDYSVQEEQKYMDKIIQSKEKFVDFTNKARDVRIAGNQFQNALRNMFGMKQKEVSNKELPGYNFIMDRLQDKIARSQISIDKMKMEYSNIMESIENSRERLSMLIEKESEKDLAKEVQDILNENNPGRTSQELFDDRSFEQRLDDAEKTLHEQNEQSLNEREGRDVDIGSR